MCLLHIATGQYSVVAIRQQPIRRPVAAPTMRSSFLFSPSPRPSLQAPSVPTPPPVDNINFHSQSASGGGITTDCRLIDHPVLSAFHILPTTPDKLWARGDSLSHRPSDEPPGGSPPLGKPTRSDISSCHAKACTSCTIWVQRLKIISQAPTRVYETGPQACIPLLLLSLPPVFIFSAASSPGRDRRGNGANPST